ncbi:unnamed protein product [Clavelina lepadiformis]|uniref:Vacuolar protein sorting-associated protein 8 central domain-containing protein n=1 Tax=Clavelina lepadiformis TaxID=159417 RepID=A0ABP0GPE7_CLALP
MDILDNDDLEELDADEFDIPEVETPTLESILNESDDDDDPLISLDDVTDQGLNPSDNDPSTLVSPAKNRTLPELNVLKNWETTSIASTDSKKKREIDADQHGSVLSLTKEQGLSRQMLDAMERVNAGRPTTLAASSMFAVGTARGLVLLFDASQAMKFCLGSTKIGSKYGSVTALTFNSDSTRILVGYAKGEILMYDITSGKLLRTITDAHPPGSAVLHVKFTDDPTLAVCNDSGGSVFELNFRRVMGVRSCESRCLFSGSRGEVCAIETLHLGKNVADHPFRDRHLLAMGTLSKVLVVTLRPQIKILFSHKLAINPTCVPLLAWQLSVIRLDGNFSVDVILMFARGDVIYFFQVKSQSWDVFNFVHLRTMNLTYKLINTCWLNHRTVLLLDIRERAHVVDVDSQTNLETKPLDHINLVYNSATFKSIATGGNVSQALAMIGEHACYQSMIPFNKGVAFLGIEAVFTSTINTWRERINIALRSGHQQALKLALTFYDGSAKAIVGLPADPNERKRVISDVMLDILVEYVDLAMTKLCPDSGKLQVLINFYRNVVPICVDHCLRLNRVDVLFGRIYERFRPDCIAHGAFLECLEPYILKDKLKEISPVVMKDFIEHFQAKHMLSNVENCLLHLDMRSLDLNQVMHMCWAHGLYDAIISIHNRGMKDFIGPLCELLVLLQSALDTGIPLSDKITTLGNKLLVYVSCCLAGLAYPHGIMDQETSKRVKQQMFSCLVQPHLNEKNMRGLYPIINILLRFSTKEFLNVLSLSFSEPDFQDSEGIKVQNFVDVLLQVMLENEGFKPDQVGSLFTFLARQSARQGARLQLNETLKNQVVEFLTTPGDQATDHEERQQALVDLLQCGILAHSDNSRLITLAERASFYRVLRFLNSQRRRYDLVFLAHLRDPAQKDHVFTFIRDVLGSSAYSDVEKQKTKDTVLEHIKDLISLNGKQAASLVTTVLQGSIQTIAAKLHDEPFILFTFLQGLFSSEKQDVNDFITDSYFGDDDTHTSQPSDPDTCELYLSLMCQFDRDQVLTFIQDCDVMRRHRALEIVRRHRVDDATAYLLEESGDITGAFNILLAMTRDKMKLLDAEEETMALEEEVMSAVGDVVRLCQRNSSKLLEKQREKFWFSLLDVVLQSLHGARNADDVIAKRLARYVLTSMIGHMTLPAVLQKIIQDPAYKGGKFAEIKDLLLGMLETYRYESTLLGTTLNLLARARHETLVNLRRNVTRGVAPRSQFCTLCRRSILHLLGSERQNLVVFSCGTVYHEACIRLELNPGSNPHHDRDHKCYETSLKRSEYQEGLLASMAACLRKEDKPQDRARDRNRSSGFRPPFDPKNFSLKTKHPPLKFN